MNGFTQSIRARRGVAAALLCSLGLLACSTTGNAPLPTVEAVDLQRYAGDWYEIARLPNVFQSACASDTVARYRVEGGGGVSVRNRCRRADGSIDSIEGSASVVPGSGGARMKVTFFWPFRGDYWILAIDPSYQAVLVGEPRRKFAWVLSRTPVMDQQRLDSLLDRAQALGFERSAFERTPQRQPIPEAIADPPRMDR
jgi:apolipoprotein D and lipocalin family protein